MICVVAAVARDIPPRFQPVSLEREFRNPTRHAMYCQRGELTDGCRPAVTD